MRFTARSNNIFVWLLVLLFTSSSSNAHFCFSLNGRFDEATPKNFPSVKPGDFPITVLPASLVKKFSFQSIYESKHTHYYRMLSKQEKAPGRLMKISPALVIINDLLGLNLVRDTMSDVVHKNLGLVKTGSSIDEEIWKTHSMYDGYDDVASGHQYALEQHDPQGRTVFDILMDPSVSDTNKDILRKAFNLFLVEIQQAIQVKHDVTTMVRASTPSDHIWRYKPADFSKLGDLAQSKSLDGTDVLWMKPLSPTHQLWNKIVPAKTKSEISKMMRHQSSRDFGHHAVTFQIRSDMVMIDPMGQLTILETN